MQAGERDVDTKGKRPAGGIHRREPAARRAVDLREGAGNEEQSVGDGQIVDGRARRHVGGEAADDRSRSVERDQPAVRLAVDRREVPADEQRRAVGGERVDGAGERRLERLGDGTCGRIEGKEIAARVDARVRLLHLRERAAHVHRRADRRERVDAPVVDQRGSVRGVGGYHAIVGHVDRRGWQDKEPGQKAGNEHDGWDACAHPSHGTTRVMLRPDVLRPEPRADALSPSSRAQETDPWPVSLGPRSR